MVLTYLPGSNEIVLTHSKLSSQSSKSGLAGLRKTMQGDAIQ